MILTGARFAINATDSLRADLLIRGRRVFVPPTSARGSRTIDLAGFLILPGLINAHDHLELNLFPRLGRGPYPSATEWAKDIYRPEEPLLSMHRRVPKPVRLFWGGMKNLLSGVTYVAHHNPYYPDTFDNQFPVRVLKRYGWAHSARFSPDWRQRFRLTPPGAPFVIHAAEGIDEHARHEIHELDAASAIGPSTVMVHGVALALKDMALLQKRGASLIWCPTSNNFMLGRTLRHEILHSKTPIALGSDSALTAQGDFVDELQSASQFLDPVRLYKMVTTDAASILYLRDGAGRIQNGGIADLLAVRDHGQTPAEALIGLQPELIFIGGKIHLASSAIANRLPLFDTSSKYHRIDVEDRGTWLTPFEIPDFIDQAKQSLGEDLRLAGKRVTP